MSFNLFALCKNKSQYEVKRIPLNEGLQCQIAKMFDVQKEALLANKQEVEYSGDWKPDDDEIFVLPLTEEFRPICDTYNYNFLLQPVLDLQDYESSPIKALFGSDDNGRTIMVQKFSPSQYLTHQFSIFLDGRVYNKIDTPSINIANQLTCIISDGCVKFTNLGNMRSIFDMKEIYAEATDGDIDAFAANSQICVENVDNLKHTATQNIRKRIHNLLKAHTLDKYSAADICERAQAQGFADLITIENSQIAFPNDTKQIVKILSFLDEKLYKGAFTHDTIMANSTRKAN